MPTLAPIKRLVPSSQIDFKPWDVYSIEGQGKQNEETGEFPNYKIKIWPGSVAGIVPDRMFEEFNVPNSLQYLILTATANRGIITSATLSWSSNPSIQVQAATPDSPPGSFKTIIGAWNKGAYYNIKQYNILPEIVVAFIVSATNATPFGLPYRNYYIWTRI
jgi:hypothetical protein